MSLTFPAPSPAVEQRLEQIDALLRDVRRLAGELPHARDSRGNEYPPIEVLSVVIVRTGEGCRQCVLTCMRQDALPNMLNVILEATTQGEG